LIKGLPIDKLSKENFSKFTSQPAAHCNEYEMVLELRPPSPTKEESDSGSEYMDDDSDDEAEEAQV